MNWVSPDGAGAYPGGMAIHIVGNRLGRTTATIESSTKVDHCG